MIVNGGWKDMLIRGRWTLRGDQMRDGITGARAVGAGVGSSFTIIV